MAKLENPSVNNVSVRRHLIVAFLYSTFISLGIAGVLISIPAVVTSIVQHDNPNDTEKEVLAKSATYQSFTYAIMAITSCLLLTIAGRLSDIYGRKPILFLSCITLFISVLLMQIGYHFNMLWPVYGASVFLICDGLAQVAGMAYVSDLCFDEKDKSKNFGLIVASSIIGVIAGSTVIGELTESHFEWVFVLLFVTAALNIAFVAVFMKETLPRKTQEQDQEKPKLTLAAINPFRAFKMFFMYTPVLTTLVVVFALFYVLDTDENAGYLYAQYRYNWHGQMNGIQTATNSAATIAFQLIGIRLLTKYFSDEHILTGLFFVNTFFSISYGLAPNGWIYLVAQTLGGFFTVVVPVIEAQMSNQVGNDNQATLFGGIITISFIAQFIGDLTLENTFSLCMKSWYFSCPGTPFFISAIICFITFIICFILYKKYPPKPKGYIAVDINDGGEV